jgi:hypothetical protein
VCLSAGLCVGSGLGLVRLFVEIRGGASLFPFIAKKLFIYFCLFACI